MVDKMPQRVVIFLLRMAMAWTFLYAASHQVFVSNFSVTGFLGTAKTFHGLFELFDNIEIVSTIFTIITFYTIYDHLNFIFGKLNRDHFSPLLRLSC